MMLIIIGMSTRMLVIIGISIKGTQQAEITRINACIPTITYSTLLNIALAIPIPILINIHKFVIDNSDYDKKTDY